MKETFGQRFQRLRKSANLTQEEVATKLNISAQAVSKWENDLSAPDISVLGDLSAMLGVTTDQLLGVVSDEARVDVVRKKSVDEISFRVNVLSSDGDKIKVNMPFALVKVFADNGASMPQVNGKDFFGSIDLKQLIDLAEKGVLGRIVEVDSKDGDHIEVVIE